MQMRSATLQHLRSLKGARSVAPLAVERFQPGSQQASAGRPPQRAVSGSRRCDSARPYQTAVCATRRLPTSPATTPRVTRQRCCSGVRPSMLAGMAAPAELGRGISGLTFAAASDNAATAGLAHDRLFPLHRSAAVLQHFLFRNISSNMLVHMQSLKLATNTAQLPSRV